MLTEMQLRKAIALSKPYKLTDERGMYLRVNSAGRYWRLDYRFGGNRKTMALGVYPGTGLAEARRLRACIPSSWRSRTSWPAAESG